MKQILEEIKQMSKNELIRASSKFGATNSGNHESYAIILEEYEEAKENDVYFAERLKEYWVTVRQDQANKNILLNMADSAMSAAAEWIQVAAMCQKAINTIERVKVK